ncbi:MAG: patatin-like phospholipase family protein, partial [Bacteroidota bacterium]
FLSIIVTELSKLRKKWNAPVFFLTLFLLIIFSFFNNNHALRFGKENTSRNQTITDNFDQWLSYKLQQPYFIKNDTARIYVMAAEGGGIRSAYWTAGLLVKLQNEFPDLMRNTYAMSGVSGGSVGLATFNAYYRDHCLPSNRKADTTDIKTILGEDFLSPLLAGMLFPDMVQRFLPFPIESFSRARQLENSWSNIYEDVINENTPNLPLQELWNDNNRFDLPNLFFNTTRVETGNKSLISNLKLDKRYFPAAIDVENVSGKQYLLKSATFASARFPFVTPVAKISDEDGDYWGNIVDGGYFDNTGLHTALEIHDMIREELKEKSLDSNLTIIPTLIFFRNSQSSVDSTTTGLKNLYETTAPLLSFYNSWLSRANYFTYDVDNISQDIEFDYARFHLPDTLNGEQIKFPLGWTLSEITQKNMDALIKDVDNDARNKEFYDRLKSWMK